METNRAKFLENYIKSEMEIIEIENEGVLCSSDVTTSTNVLIKGFNEGGVFDTELH